MRSGDMDLNEEDMANLAEMSAMVLSMLGQVQAELDTQKVQAWHKLCVRLLKMARNVPSIRQHMELNPDCGYWFFKRPYIEEAFYSDLLDEFRDNTFWNELVTRTAEQGLLDNFDQEEILSLTEEQRTERVSSMEKALWKEVTRHGISRMGFMLSPEES